MNKPKIELFKDFDGDWAILRINDEEIESGHSICPEDILVWLDTNGHIEYADYSRDSNEYTKDNSELLYDDMPKWLQDFDDEFPVEMDGH